MSSFNQVEFYKKYIDKVTCAFKHNIYLDGDGKERCGAKRTEEREKYLFKGLTDEVVLIECPLDILALEFETHDTKKEKVVDKKQIKEWIEKTKDKLKAHKLNYCVCDHGGTSPWIYVCNITGLIEGREKDCKKEIAKLVIPTEAIDFVDRSNLGTTLIPIINRPHWKTSKYNGTLHKIVDGINPNEHKNKIPDVALQRVLDWERPNYSQQSDWGEDNINSISLSSVVGTMGLKKRGSEYQGVNPWHGSDTGMNFCYNPSKNVWHCFRCDCGGSVAKAIALNQGIINSCDESLTKEQFIEVLKVAKEKYGLKDKKPEQIFTSKGQTDYYIERKPIFYDKSGMFWVWCDKEKRWIISDDVDVLNVIEEELEEDVITQKNRTEILNTLKQRGRKLIPKSVKPTWIQFKDKIVDVKTGEEFDATPKYFVTNPIPWKMNDNKYEDTPVMDKIFEQWVGKKYVKTLYEIIAYSLIPDYPINRLFCFVGEGMNGKSKFLELLTNFVGEDNCTSTELDTLLTSRFEVTRLHKKLICQMGETNFNEMSKTSILKKLTGGDMIGFEYKNKNPFHDKNYAKIIISTNNLPTTIDKTLGFYRHWMIIDFPNRFTEEKDILKDIPDKEYECLARKSISLLADLLKKRGFHNEGSVEERMERYESKADFLQKFVNDFTMESSDGYITKSDFQRKFIDWCKENRHRQMSDRSIGMAMKKRGMEDGKKHLDWVYDGKGGNVRVWINIKWREE